MLGMNKQKNSKLLNGPIVFTTNCLVPPRKGCTYTDRVYTTGNTGHPDFKVIPMLGDGSKDFSLVIEHALKVPAPTQIWRGEIIVDLPQSSISTADSVVSSISRGFN